MDALNEIKYLPKQNLNIRIDCNKFDEQDTSIICNKSVEVIFLIYYVTNYPNYYII